MTRKNSNKVTARELKKSVSTILVANDKDFRPYIEIFEFTGENIIQQQLGTLLGILEIIEGPMHKHLWALPSLPSHSMVL